MREWPAPPGRFASDFSRSDVYDVPRIFLGILSVAMLVTPALAAQAAAIGENE